MSHLSHPEPAHGRPGCKGGSLWPGRGERQVPRPRVPVCHWAPTLQTFLLQFSCMYVSLNGRCIRAELSCRRGALHRGTGRSRVSKARCSGSLASREEIWWRRPTRRQRPRGQMLGDAGHCGPEGHSPDVQGLAHPEDSGRLQHVPQELELRLWPFLGPLCVPRPPLRALDTSCRLCLPVLAQ